MPKFVDSGAKGTFEFPDDASEAEIQAALAELDRPAAVAASVTTPAVAVPSQAAPPTDFFGPIRRFNQNLSSSPTVQAISGVADRVVSDAPVLFRGLRDVASTVGSVAGKIAANTLPARVIRRGYENFMTPVKAYNAARLPVANFVGDVAGTVVPPMMRGLERAAPYLEYANPTAKLASLPVQAALTAGGRAIAGAAESAVPAVFALRDSLSRAGAAVGDAAAREADYWRNLPPSPRPTPAAMAPPPVVRVPGYPQAPVNPQQREVGVTYLTPAGPKIWVGNGWTDDPEAR